MNSSTKTIFVAALATFAALAVFGILVQGASATTITVDATGAGDYTTIQDALNASADNDTIYVHDGTYVESLYIPANYIILSAAAGQHPIIRGADYYTPAITVSGEGVNITGFTIEHAYEFCIRINWTANNASIVGNTLSGEFAKGVSVLSNGSVFFGNNFRCGGGASIAPEVFSCNNSIRCNTFINCGGMSVVGIPSPCNEVFGNTFENASFAIYVGASGSWASITHNILRNASISAYGVSNCTVAYNNITRMSDAGIIAMSCVNSNIDHNEITGSGFCMRLAGAGTLVYHNAMFGGGVEISEMSSARMPVFEENTIDGKYLFYKGNCNESASMYGTSMLAQVIISNVTSCTLEGGSYDYPALILESSYITIRNFTMVNWAHPDYVNYVNAIMMLKANHSAVESCTMRNFGRAGILMISSDNNTIRGNNISYMNMTWPDGIGVSLEGSSNNTIANNSFSYCRVGVDIRTVSHRNTINSNNIYSNTQSGINYNDEYGDCIGDNITNNWWGAASGPYNATANPSGAGDNFTVSEYGMFSDVPAFSPWLGEPAVVTAAAPESSATPSGGALSITSFTANATSTRVNWSLVFALEISGPVDTPLSGTIYTGDTNMDFTGAILSNGTFYAGGLAWYPTAAGQRSVRLMILNSNDTSAPAVNATLNITVADASGAAPTSQLLIVSVTSDKATAALNESVNFTVVLMGPDQDVLCNLLMDNGTVIANLPYQRIANGTTTFTGLLWEGAAAPGTYGFTPRASLDGVDYVNGTRLVVTVTNTTLNTTRPVQNLAPVIVSVTTNRVIMGANQTATITVTAYDPEGTALTYNYMSMDGQIIGTGNVVSWSPVAAFPGTYMVEVMVGDGALSTTSRINITVVADASAINNPPVVTIILVPSFNGNVNGTLSITGTATDDAAVHQVQVSIDNGTWQLLSGTTTWAYSIDTTTLGNGAHSVKVRAYDGTNYSNEQTLSLNVNNAAGASSSSTPAKGFLPGFEVASVLAVLGAALLVFGRRKRE